MTIEDQPLVALVIPVHNSKDDTREFLESLKQLSYPNYKTIIIDDGSIDGTEEMIRQEYPEVVLLKGDGNLWSSNATNMGMEKAIEIGAKYIGIGSLLRYKTHTIFLQKLIKKIIDAGVGKNIFSGIDLGIYRREWENYLLIAVTEKRTCQEMNDFVKFLSKF